jgi:hypothetical protein
MRSHLLIRMAAATTLLTGVATGAVMTASPAHATQIQQCTGGYTFVEDYGVGEGAGGTTIVFVYEYDQCNNEPFSIDFPVSIAKYVGNVGWETVASGMGYTQYTCTGGRFLYSTSVNAALGKPDFYCPS